MLTKEEQQTEPNAFKLHTAVQNNRDAMTKQPPVQEKLEWNKKAYLILSKQVHATTKVKVKRVPLHLVLSELTVYPAMQLEHLPGVEHDRQLGWPPQAAIGEW